MFGAPVTVTPPAGELITTDSAKSYLRVDGNALDAEVAMITAAAIDDLQQRTGVRLLNQTVSVTADSFADLELFRVGPIRQVASIKYRDGADAEQTVSAEDYELFGAALEQGVRPVEGWPSAKAGSIIATLDVGYGATAAAVPPKLLFAAYALLRGKFEGTEVDVEALTANYRFWL